MSRHRSQIFRAESDIPSSGGEPSSPGIQGYNVPGRNPNSQAPFEFFLGNAAHRLIAYMYKVKHPTHRAFYNTKRVAEILQDGEIGDPAQLLAGEPNLCPDITDLSVRYLFEIKP